MSKLTPSTAFTEPSSRSKIVFRFLIDRRGLFSVPIEINCMDLQRLGVHLQEYLVQEP